MKPVMSIVVPLRIMSSRSRDLSRLANLLQVVPVEIEVVVADDSPCKVIREKIERLVSSRRWGLYVYCCNHSLSVFSIGNLRNRGSELASTELLLLHDVDFIASKDTYRKIVSSAGLSILLERNEKAFCCIPVLFTSPVGWLLRSPLMYALKSKLCRGYLRTFIGLWLGRLVMGSSAILIRRQHYMGCGGHSAIFRGHGAEDFELLHRLSALYPLGERPKNYEFDCGPLGFESMGFREYFSRYGKPAAEKGISLIHQWHPSRKEDPQYINTRRANFQHLYTLLSGE